MRTVKAPFLSALIRVHNNSVIETIIIVMFDDGHSGNRKGHISHLNRNAYCCVVFDKKIFWVSFQGCYIISVIFSSQKPNTKLHNTSLSKSKKKKSQM